MKCKLKIVLESAMHLYLASENGTLDLHKVLDCLRKRINADILDTQGCFYDDEDLVMISLVAKKLGYQPKSVKQSKISSRVEKES